MRRCLHPGLFCALGLLWLLVLILQAPPEVAFCGDNGLKALIARQVAHGDFGVDLRLPAPAWVAAVWNQGLFPFSPPFVFQGALSGRYFSTFPPYFALLTVPFFDLWGGYGRLLVPLLATLGQWLLLWRLMALRRASPTLQGVTVGLLALGSPLTLYGSTYWEHAPCYFLVLAGVAPWLVPASARRPRFLVLAGLALGLSPWMRPECLSLLAVVLAWLAWQVYLGRVELKPALLYGGAAALACAGLVILNLHWFHKALGIYHHQVAPGVSLARQTALCGYVATSLLGSLLVRWPLLILVPVLVYKALREGRRRGEVEGELPLLLTVSLCFGLALSYALSSSAYLQAPGQFLCVGGLEWGPRCLLVLLPLWLPWLVEQAATRRGGPWRPLLGVLGVGGVLANLVGGSLFYCSLMRANAAAYAFVNQRPESVVVVSHQMVSQQLAMLCGSKQVFQVIDEPSLLALLTALERQHIEELLVVVFEPMPSLFGHPAQPVLVGQCSDARELLLEPLGRQGPYPCYHARVRRLPAPSP